MWNWAQPAVEKVTNLFSVSIYLKFKIKAQINILNDRINYGIYESRVMKSRLEKNGKYFWALNRKRRHVASSLFRMFILKKWRFFRKR